jgi:hypothetical protein
MKCVNWSNFLFVLAANLIAFFNSLTSENRKPAIIIDDTLYERPYSNKTELISRVYDYVERRFARGYRTLFMVWNDGASTVPLSFRHMSSKNETNRYCEMCDTDKRSNAYKAKKEALLTTTEVLLRMLKDAKRFLIPAKHVLFDSWFAFSGIMIQVCGLGYHVISVAKRQANMRFLFNGEKKSLIQIYCAAKKRRGRAKYKVSVAIQIYNRAGETIPARLVFVTDTRKKKKGDWLALICTDMSLTEEEIIAMYGRRWAIETFFKVCKSYLRFTGEFRQTTYEAITAHTSIVAVRYMILSVEHRCRTDERSYGPLFYDLVDEAKDVTVEEALPLILALLVMTLESRMIYLDEQQIIQVVADFVNKLSEHVKISLLHGSS